MTDRSVQFRSHLQTRESQPMTSETMPTEQTIAKELVDAMQAGKAVTAAGSEEEQDVNVGLVLAVNEFVNAVYMTTTGATQQ